MAKLLPPYILCPLVEHKKCLGVYEDSTPGCVIVTLGKNIVIRYRLSDQKQVSSWSSKDKLSAPVVFDFLLKRYVAIFKYDQIAFWHDSLAQLNKLKKFKFSRLIYSVLSSKECPPVVVYQDGNIGTLEDEMTSRKNVKVTEKFLEESEEIVSCSLLLISSHLFVSLLTLQKENSVKKLHFIPVDADRADRFHISLEDRSDRIFNAHTVIECETTSLITLWSDGSIFSIDLPLKDSKLFPGRFLSKMESIDLLQQAVMHSVGEQQVVIYGAAPNSEGAVLCVFNLKYGLIDSLQKLKVYSDTPRLWVVGAIGTNRYILCLSGGHLVVVPTRFVTQKLCSLVGVAKVSWSDFSILAQTSSFDHRTTSNSYDTEGTDHIMEIDAHKVTKEVLEMRERGLPDNIICEEILPALLENGDQEKIIELLNLIKDIPDYWLIEIAVKFNKKTQAEQLLEKVLRRPLVSDSSSLQHVRSRVNLPVALDLLAIISRLLEEHPLDKSLLDWACLLLDSHYQQYLLTKDESVIETITNINNIVKRHVECLTSIKSLQAELLSLSRGRIQSKKNSISSHNYLVDTINLYKENMI